jgi:hypothetical protein
MPSNLGKRAQKVLKESDAIYFKTVGIKGKNE